VGQGSSSVVPQATLAASEALFDTQAEKTTHPPGWGRKQ
jgi:hypothetical protein